MTARQRSLLTDKLSITASSEDDVLLEDKVEMEEKEIQKSIFLPKILGNNSHLDKYH